MKLFITSGGLGDAWIQALKISGKLSDHSETFGWEHITGQSIHVGPVNALQKIFTKTSFCTHIPRNKAEERIRAVCKDTGAIRVSSRTQEEDMVHNAECLKPKILPENLVDNPYIVVQPIAGRTNDNSKRILTKKVVRDIAIEVSDTSVVLLGASMGRLNIPESNIIDKMGATTIHKAISYVWYCDMFIGYHGFLAYVAMSLGKKSVILFDDPRLLSHYMNSEWKKNTTIVPVHRQINSFTILDNAKIILEKL